MRQFIAIIILTTTHSFALAAFISPTDWQRGDQGSAYLEWQSFNHKQTNTQPDIGASNIQSVQLQELVGQSFLASSNNLYSLTHQAFTMTVATTAQGPSILSQDVSVNLQVSTWGNPVDASAATLNGQTGNIQKLYEGPDESSGNWNQIDYLISWTIPASGLYIFNFELDQAHTSLSGVAVDMFGLASLSGIIPLPQLPILPPLPGDSVFNGQQLDVADYAGQIETITEATAQTSIISSSSSSRHMASAIQVSQVPVPSSVLLFGSALASLIARKRFIKYHD